MALFPCLGGSGGTSGISWVTAVNGGGAASITKNLTSHVKVGSLILVDYNGNQWGVATSITGCTDITSTISVDPDVSNGTFLVFKVTNASSVVITDSHSSSMIYIID